MYKVVCTKNLTHKNYYTLLKYVYKMMGDRLSPCMSEAITVHCTYLMCACFS